MALFLNAVHEMHSSQEVLDSTRSYMARVCSYIPMNIPMTGDRPQAGSGHCPDLVRYISAEVLFRDVDDLFDRFKRECHLDEISKVTGLTMEAENTIVRPWPMRLRENAT